MNLSKLKLKALLLSGFGIIVFLTISLLVGISVLMNRMSDLTEGMHKHPLIISNAVRDIQNNIYAMNLELRYAVLNNEFEYVQSCKLKIDSLERVTLEKFKLVKASYLGNPTTVEESYRLFLDWRPIRNETLQCIHQNESAKAINLLCTKNTTLILSILSEIDKMNDFANDKADSFYKDSIQLRKSYYFTVVFFSFLLIVLSLIIALVTIRSITAPINKIIRRIVQISKNNFNVDIDFKGNNHLKILEDSVIKLEDLSNEWLEQYNSKMELQTNLEKSQEALIYILEDVNEIKSELEKTVLKLQQSNEEMQSFIYSVSHDLRAPLRSIMGFSQIISKRHIANLNEEGTEYFGYIIEASKNMANLIEDLLRYSRLAKSPVHKEAVDLNEVLGKVILNLTQDIQHHKANISIPENLPTIRGERSLFGQIFLNLFQNAIMYHRDNINPEIVFSCEEDNNTFTIRVKDNGLGIAEEHLNKIFNIFQRLHSNEKHPGTGIGLAIVKKAVQALGGKITVESEVNIGSTFIIVISNE